MDSLRLHDRELKKEKFLLGVAEEVLEEAPVVADPQGEVLEEVLVEGEEIKLKNIAF